MTTKDKLIDLAGENGFIGDLNPYKNDTEYYLWMCLLQKWIREYYDIHVYVGIKSYHNIKMYIMKPHARNSNYLGNSYRHGANDPSIPYKIKEYNFDNSYEKCLELLLYKTLKLIK